MSKAKSEESELTQLLCCLRIPLERAIENIGLHDAELPKNATVTWTTSKDTIERLLDHINRLSVSFGHEYTFKDISGGTKTGVLRHKTYSGRFYIDTPERNTSHVCEWEAGTFVERAT